MTIKELLEKDQQLFYENKTPMVGKAKIQHDPSSPIDLDGNETFVGYPGSGLPGDPK